MNTATILVVDDEPQIRRALRATLTGHGYVILEARNGEEALEMIRREKVDLILLDVNMPGINGVETCREIRTVSEVPIIMLTVRNAELDKVRALDEGADDYVVKPFGIQELLARIRVALRRVTSIESIPALRTKDLSVDFGSRTVLVHENPVHLTPKEFDLLSYLASRPNRTISHRELLQAVWGPDYGEELEYLRVFVNRVRKKIEPDPSNPRYLITDAWAGYRFHVAEENTAPSGRPQSD